MKHRFGLWTLMFALLFMKEVCSAQVETSGIFLVTKFRKKCPYKSLQVTEKQRICIVEQPIIPVTDFDYITEIKTNSSNFPYFHLVLTEQGYDRLKKLSAELPETQFVLVADNSVIGFMKNMDVLRSKFLIIDSASPSGDGLDVVRQKLTAIPTLRRH